MSDNTVILLEVAATATDIRNALIAEQARYSGGGGLRGFHTYHALLRTLELLAQFEKRVAALEGKPDKDHCTYWNSGDHKFELNSNTTCQCGKSTK